MPNLLYYTDCPFYSGSERMLKHFLSNSQRFKNFQVQFFYRYSPLYARSINQLPLDNSVAVHPVHGIYTFLFLEKLKPSFYRRILFLLEAWILKYPMFLCNVIVLFLQFRKYHPYIVHINNGGYPGANSCNAAVVAAALCGTKKIIYVVNNLAVSRKKPTRWLDGIIDKIVRRLVTSFVTGSQAARAQLISVLNIDANQAVNIANGIEIRPISKVRGDMRKSLNISQDQMAVGIIAVLEERKGHIYALQALSVLIKRGVKPPLLFIEGVGPEESRLRQYVIAHDLTGYVYFLGCIDNVHALINAMDFTMLPSISQEDFPNVILESMALGVPVIGTKIAGIPEQIEHEVSGLLVEPASASSLAQAMEFFLRAPALLQCYGDAAKKRFEENFTVDKAMDKYRLLYQEI